MARLRHEVNIGGGRVYYVTENVVMPKYGSVEVTDVMLVQFLVKKYFEDSRDNGIDAAIAKFDTIVGPKRFLWVDGVYGSKTRDAILLFEQCTVAPYKDGIVRPICSQSVVFSPSINYFEATKLEKLNWNFIQNEPNFASQRLHIKVANKVLGARLFGG